MPKLSEEKYEIIPDFETATATAFKNEAWAYFAKCGFRVRRVSDSPKIWPIFLDAIYSKEGELCYAAYMAPGEVEWYADADCRIPLPVVRRVEEWDPERGDAVRIGAFNVCVRGFWGNIGAVVHEVIEYALTPERVEGVPDDAKKVLYRQREPGIKLLTEYVISTITPGALLRLKARWLRRLVDFWRRVGRDRARMYSEHGGALVKARDDARMIRERFSEVGLGDHRLHELPESAEGFTIAAAKCSGYYFNRIVEAKLEPDTARDISEVYIPDSAVATLNEADEFLKRRDSMAKKLGVRSRDECHWRY